jgi:hypothetical protein
MYVIADNGHCVINGLRQVKVYRERTDADQALANMTENGSNTQGFTVQYVQIIGGRYGRDLGDFRVRSVQLTGEGDA